MADVDLDRLAVSYAHRPPTPASLRRAADAGERLRPRSRILDVGGGLGNHASVWRDGGHHPIVLDPSGGMLRTVYARGLAAVRGRAQDIPFRNGTFDLVWFHLSIHYGDWRRAVDEADRVVATPGRVEIWTLGPDHHEQSLLTRWFPTVGAIDRDRFPKPEAVAERLGARFPEVATDHFVEVVTRSASSWIAAVEAGFVSTLQLLSDEERRSGIEAARRRYADPDEEVHYEMRYTRITADRLPD